MPTILLASLNNLKPDNDNILFAEALTEPADIKPEITADGQVVSRDESTEFNSNIKQEVAHFSGQAEGSAGNSDFSDKGTVKSGKSSKDKLRIEIAKRKLAMAKAGKVGHKYISKVLSETEGKVDLQPLPKRGRPKKSEQRPVKKKESKPRRSIFILRDNGKEYKVKSWRWAEEKRAGSLDQSEHWNTIPAEKPGEYYCFLCSDSDTWTNEWEYVQHWIEKHVKLTDNGGSLVECPHCSHTQYYKFCRTQLGRWLHYLLRFCHHLVKKHQMSTPRFVETMICKKCGYSAPGNTRYTTEHMRICGQAENRKKYICTKCGTELVTSAGYIHHNRVCQVILY